jgi:membrane associated rhomboid family serine protease
MVRTFADDFKREWNKPDNMVVRLVLINLIVWLVYGIIHVTSDLFGIGAVALFIKNSLYVNSSIFEVLWKPWTLITYSFVHLEPIHLIFNMLFLYWFGTMLRDIIGGNRVLGLYILGAIAGSVFYIIMYNSVPKFSAVMSSGYMLGASGSVYAIVVATATLRPNSEIRLFLLGNVQLKYIALAGILFSFFALVGENPGGQIAHLGGAALGYIFVIQYNKGNDWSKFVVSSLNWIKNIFATKPNLKASKSKKKKKAKGKATSDKSKSTTSGTQQEIIDAILDKISEGGYQSLSNEEKQILFKASQKK